MRETAEHAPAAEGHETTSFPIVPAAVAVAVALSVFAGVVYWFRAPILDAITSAREAIVSTLGLGVLPTVAWLGVFAIALGWRRGWLRHYRLWLGSVAFLAATLGALAFFSPAEGALAAFTLGGESSLGGGVGQAVVGSTVWLGALRLFAVIAFGVAVVAPPVAVAVAFGLGRAGPVLLGGRGIRGQRHGCKLEGASAAEERAVTGDFARRRSGRTVCLLVASGLRRRACIRARRGNSGGGRLPLQNGILPVRWSHRSRSP